jgi:hypothetical protein
LATVQQNYSIIPEQLDCPTVLPLVHVPRMTLSSSKKKESRVIVKYVALYKHVWAFLKVNNHSASQLLLAIKVKKQVLRREIATTYS